MADKLCFKALDRSLKDILRPRFPNSLERLFRGITVVLRGDFRQILPFVPKGSRNDIIEVSITSSYLWPYFEVITLSIKMRLHTYSAGQLFDVSLAEFEKWLLAIGDGHSEYTNKNDMVRVPSDMVIKEYFDPKRAIIDTTYPNLLDRYEDQQYLEERAILTTKNEIVHEINKFVMDILLG